MRAGPSAHFAEGVPIKIIVRKPSLVIIIEIILLLYTTIIY